MLQLMDDMPPHVVAVKATGEVNKADFESVLLPALTNVSDNFGEIYFLLLLDTDISNFTWGAWWEDFKAGISFFTRWKKIAIVTDSKAVEKFSDFFTIVTPGASKGFQRHELEEAKLWIKEK